MVLPRLVPRCALVVVGVLAALVLAEWSWRRALFGDGWLADRLGPRLRRAELYADGTGEDAYWKLRYLFAGSGARALPNVFDPLLGWCGAQLDPETYLPRRRMEERGRRPILLYGDSFAACTTKPHDCFEGLLLKSDLAERHVLHNYGVGGYGLDQIYLLLRASLDLFAEEDPLVVVSLLVEDDLDRAVLGMRSWPKPLFDVRDGQLVEPEAVLRGADEHIAAHPVGIRSYVWRYLLHGSDLLPESLVRAWTGEPARIRRKSDLGRALVVAIQRELEERGLDYFFLLFDGPGSLRGEGEWQFELVEGVCGELGIPYVRTRHDLVADARRTGRGLEEYFESAGRAVGHYNPLGNEVAFRTLRRGVEQVLDDE